MYFNNLKNVHCSGTTSANASEAMRTKKENPWRDEYVFPLGFYREGMYVPAVCRKGLQFTNDEIDFYLDDDSTNIAPTSIRSAKISPTLFVVAFLDANGFLNVRAGKVPPAGGAATYGSIYRVTNVTTYSIDIIGLHNGCFALSYLQGTNIYVQLGSVDASTYAVTMGNQRGVCDDSCENSGTAIASPIEGYIVVVYSKDATGFGYAAALEYTDSLIGDVGEELSLVTTVNIPAMCKISERNTLLAYQDSGATDDPITVMTLTIDESDLSLTKGTSKTLAGTAGAATCVNVVSNANGTVVVGWIDNSDPHVRAATVDELELKWGAEAALTTDNAAYLRLAMLSDGSVLAAWENTSQSNYLYTTTITVSTNTATVASYPDPAVEAASIYVDLLAFDNEHFLLLFADSADSSYMKEQYGQVKKNLVDIRSTTASIAFDGYLVSLGQDGLGAMGCKKITGTTNASADTVMSTKPTNPFSGTNDPNNVLVFFTDTRQYVEDDGSVKPKKSGVASGSIDVRSTTTAQAFTAYVMKILHPIQSQEVV